MASPARVTTPAPRLVSFGLSREGTGDERKWCVIRITTEGERVIERKVIERTRWRDYAEDRARRELWGRA